MIARLLIALLFILAGAAHFASPAVYLQIMPPFLPWPMALIYLSGGAEILGGVGILFSRTRKLAGIGLIALLIAVFPANIYAALHGANLSGWQVPVWLLWVRLPLQALLIGWVYLAAVVRPRR